MLTRSFYIRRLKTKFEVLLRFGFLTPAGECAASAVTQSELETPGIREKTSHIYAHTPQPPTLNRFDRMKFNQATENGFPYSPSGRLTNNFFSVLYVPILIVPYEACLRSAGEILQHRK